MFAIALNTLRELIRNRFFSVILFLGVILIALSFILETLALGELRRVLYDFGLSFIELTGLAVILFLGGGMIAREIEGRTIFLMLSKPVPRSAIFLGKFFGFAVVIIMMVIFQTILLLGLLTLKDIAIEPLLFHAVLGITLKLFALLAVILFFSVFTSPMIALFLTISSYVIGHGGYAMIDHALREGSVFMGYIGKLVLILFPNLEAMNLKNYVATSAMIDLNAWYLAYFFGLVYIVSVLLIGSFLFSKRSFDNA